jgi:CrcB protein
MRLKDPAASGFFYACAHGGYYQVSFSTCLAVMIGGAIGSLARYLISVLALPISGSLPWGTILINAGGSFLIGLFGTLTLADGRYPASESARMFVMIGLCGGFTTFSSFSLQTLDLLRSGAVVRASANVVASVVLCVCAVAVGHLIATHFNRDVRIAQIAIEEEGRPVPPQNS